MSYNIYIYVYIHIRYSERYDLSIVRYIIYHIYSTTYIGTLRVGPGGPRSAALEAGGDPEHAGAMAILPGVTWVDHEDFSWCINGINGI